MFIVSLSNWLLYEAQLTIVGDRFTGSAIIYTNAIKTGETTLSGTLSQNSQIIGQFEGSGVGQGTFTATYAPADINGNTSMLSKVSHDQGTGPYWRGVLSGPGAEFSFLIGTDGFMSRYLEPQAGVLLFCDIEGDVLALPGSALYDIATLDNPLTGCETRAIRGTILTGYGVATTAANDRFLMILTGNGYAAYAEIGLSDTPY